MKLTIFYFLENTNDIKSAKPQIRAALKTWKGIKAQKVNTLITTKGEKKAFIKLTADQDALDVA